jgi:hypothetical protein
MELKELNYNILKKRVVKRLKGIDHNKEEVEITVEEVLNITSLLIGWS